MRLHIMTAISAMLLNTDLCCIGHVNVINSEHLII